MRKRSSSAPPGSNSDGSTYVGRNHPPREHCFKPGQSGNPNGRPKGRHSFHTLVKKQLMKDVVLKDGSTFKPEEFIAKAVLSGVSKGNLKAIELYVDFVERGEASSHEAEIIELDAGRQEILQAALLRLNQSEPHDRKKACVSDSEALIERGVIDRGDDKDN